MPPLVAETVSESKVSYRGLRGWLDEVSRVMVYSGRPIEEPVAMGGPFVMNHRAEITQAFDDYRRGRFGPVPRQDRLTAVERS